MGLGVGFGDHADTLHIAILIHFAGSTKAGSPILGHWPTSNAFVIGGWHFVVFTLEANGFLSPGHFDDLENLFKHGTVVCIDFRAIHRGASDMVVLPKYVRPTVLVPT